MFDHASIAVSDWTKSKAFYDAAFAAIGAKLLEAPMQTDGNTREAGYERGGADFWLGDGGEPGPGRHYAFRVDSRARVDAFYEAAMAAGGRDNGKPGLRPRYHENYYGAFVLDPDGNNIEAVCHDPE